MLHLSFWRLLDDSLKVLYGPASIHVEDFLVFYHPSVISKIINPGIIIVIITHVLQGKLIAVCIIYSSAVFPCVFLLRSRLVLDTSDSSQLLLPSVTFLPCSFAKTFLQVCFCCSLADEGTK